MAAAFGGPGSEAPDWPGDARTPARSFVERGSGAEFPGGGGAAPAPLKPLVLHSDWTACL